MVLCGQSSGPVEPLRSAAPQSEGLALPHPSHARALHADAGRAVAAGGGGPARRRRRKPEGAHRTGVSVERSRGRPSRARGAAHHRQGPAHPVSEPVPPLVSTEWLAERLGRPGIAVVDGSMYLPTSGRDAAAEYRGEHIPGAVFFDLEATSDPRSSLPHMLPSPDRFAERMSALGLSDDDAIVVYDGSGANLSAARVWWMFRILGHARTAVLDGGIGKWKREGRPLESGSRDRTRGRFTASRVSGCRARCGGGGRGPSAGRGPGGGHALGRPLRRAPSPSRVPACAAGTFPAASAFHIRSWSPRTAPSLRMTGSADGSQRREWTSTGPSSPPAAVV